MCSAIILRRRENGSTVSPSRGSYSGGRKAPGATRSGVGAGAGLTGLGWAGGGEDGAGAPPSRNFSTSRLVTRPPRPVPRIRLRSIPCSLAIRSTSGEYRGAAPPSAPGDGCGAGAARPSPLTGGVTGRGDGAGFGAAAGVGSAWAAACEAGVEGSGAVAAPVSITASNAPIGSVSPSFAAIRAITPAAGEGISVSTLSVEIATRG